MEHNVTAPEATGLRLLMDQPPSLLRTGGSPDRADAAEVSVHRDGGSRRDHNNVLGWSVATRTGEAR